MANVSTALMLTHNHQTRGKAESPYMLVRATGVTAHLVFQARVCAESVSASGAECCV